MIINKQTFEINKKTISKFSLLLPYILITLLLIIIPLILVFIKPFETTIDSTSGNKVPVSNNWQVLGTTIWEKIGISILLAISVTLICSVFGYMFAYFLSLSKNKSSRIIAISLMTSPMWISFLVKIVGIKEVLDVIGGGPNSTYGLIFTILALSYVNLPIFVLTIYTFLNTLPKNLLEASKDLGKNSFQTFFFVVLPYTKNAIISGVTLVFLPSLTTAGVSQFVDNSNDNTLIGGILLDKGMEATTSQIALARVATLSLIICLVILILWSITVLIPKTIKYLKQNKKEVNTNA